jgi:hypothetical protein
MIVVPIPRTDRERCCGRIGPDVGSVFSQYALNHRSRNARLGVSPSDVVDYLLHGDLPLLQSAPCTIKGKQYGADPIEHPACVRNILSSNFFSQSNMLLPEQAF